MTLITSLGDHGIFWLLPAAVLFAAPRIRFMGAYMLISIGIGFLLGNVALKNLIVRDRPCWLDPTVQLLVQVPRDYSFPSGYTLVSFEGGVTIFILNREWGIPALILAVLIAFSRMYLFAHFPTDVLAGMALGIIIAQFIARTAKRMSTAKDIGTAKGISTSKGMGTASGMGTAKGSEENQRQDDERLTE